MFVSSCKRGII